MQKNLKLLALFFLLTPLLLMQSCRKDPGPDPFDDNDYLLSSNLLLMRTKENIVSVLTLVATQYPAVSEIIADVVSGVNIYKITYRTEFMGNEVTASGLICIPSAPGTYPVLSFQNGTNTLHSAAPTADPQALQYQMIEYIASTGYVVILPDYLGFGASKQMAHPYLHKESTVQTLVDMLYSVAEFDEDVAKDITVTDECYLIGYSQGGWATLALTEALEKNYGSDFTVKAASCGAGPYDLSYVNSYVLGQTQYPMPVYIAYIANAYSQYDLYANELTELFNSTYAGRIPGLFDGLHSSDQINAQLSVNVSELFRAEYISGYSTSATYLSVRNAMTANSIQGWDSNVPILFLHGTADTYVMPVLSENMHNDMIAAGSSPVTCLYVTMAGLDHGSGSVPAVLAGLEFFKAFR
ncbi:MAG: alpha/beta fold hydrolase [Bacteroidales bacterium]|nr:alpha/beta fold hydrolase [Bacteroidales bacterium]